MRNSYALSMTKCIMWKLFSQGSKPATIIFFGFKNLLIILTCIIAHGHKDERYVQYLNELWPNDPNFTIGSLLQLICTLKVTLVSKSKLLFKEPPHNSFFMLLLQGQFCCVHELCMSKKLLVQSHCQEICCSKWITMWKTTKIGIFWHFFHC